MAQIKDYFAFYPDRVDEISDTDAVDRADKALSAAASRFAAKQDGRS